MQEQRSASFGRPSVVCRFRAGLAEAAGPEDGFDVLRSVLREFDESCTASAKANVHKPESSVAIASLIAEARQALQEAALTGKLMGCSSTTWVN